jgi:ketosteroid isomerase-like protein
MQVLARRENKGHFDVPVDSGLPSGTSMLLRDQIRTSLRLTGVFVFALACVGYAHSQHSHKVHHPKRVEREEVQEIDGQWRQAMLSGDVPAMDKLLADDYLGVTAAGDMITKMQQLDRMRNRQIVFTKLDMSDVKFKLVGQIAIVTALSQVEAVADGRRIDGAFRNTRIYQRLAGGAWKITNFETTRVLPRVRQAQTLEAGPGKS